MMLYVFWVFDLMFNILPMYSIIKMRIPFEFINL